MHELTCWVGKGARVEGLILADGVAEVEPGSRAIGVEVDGNQGDHEMLELVEKCGSRGLTKVAKGTFWIAEHATIDVISSIWTLSRRERGTVAAGT